MSTPTTENPDLQNVRMPVRYNFTDKELIELGKRGVQIGRQHESLEKEFASLKADYKLRLTNLENERSRIDEKIADEFEMRDTACYVRFNDPQKGQKSFYVEATNEFIRTEALSHFDMERELPLPKDETRVLPDDPSKLRGVEIEPGVFCSSMGLGTNLGNVLTSTAAKTDQPQVVLPDWDKDDWGAKSLRVAFKKAADKAGWPKVAIETLMSQCKGSDVAAIRATLAPHVKGAKKPERGDSFGVLDENGTALLSKWGYIDTLKVLTEFPPEMHDEQKLASISDDLKDSAKEANWPDAAKTYLAHCIDGATLEELVALAERLKGSEVQP